MRKTTVLALAACLAALVPFAAMAAPAVGQRVAARWSDGNYYLATIVSVKGGDCVVKYEGGGDQDTLSIDTIIAIPDKQSFKAGDKVFAVWPDQFLRFYSGVVEKVSSAGCTVKWNDGSSPSLVPANRVLPLSSGISETIEYAIRKNGSIVGSVDSAGTVRLGGSIVGEFESDGTVRKNGSIVGSLSSNGDIRSGGSVVGRVDADGTVRKGGSIYGSIDDDGTVREGGSIIGEAEGLPKQQAAAFFFFFFLE